MTNRRAFMSGALAAGVTAALYFIFDRLLNVTWPANLLGTLLS